MRTSSDSAISGSTHPGEASEIGLNAKMSEVHAAIGLAVLPRVAEERDARLALRAAYAKALAAIPALG